MDVVTYGFTITSRGRYRSSDNIGVTFINYMENGIT